MDSTGGVPLDPLDPTFLSLPLPLSNPSPLDYPSIALDPSASTPVPGLDVLTASNESLIEHFKSQARHGQLRHQDNTNGAGQNDGKSHKGSSSSTAVIRLKTRLRTLEHRIEQSESENEFLRSKCQILEKASESRERELNSQSESLRDTMLRIQEMAMEMEELMSDRELLKDENYRVKSQNEILEREEKRLMATVKDQKQEFEGYIDQLKGQLKVKCGELERWKLENEELKREIQDTRKRFQGKIDELEVEKERLKREERVWGEERGKWRELDRQCSELNVKVEELVYYKGRSQGLEGQYKELDKKREELESECTKERDRAEKETKLRESMESEWRTMKRENERLDRELNELKRRQEEKEKEMSERWREILEKVLEKQALQQQLEWQQNSANANNSGLNSAEREKEKERWASHGVELAGKWFEQLERWKLDWRNEWSQEKKALDERIWRLIEEKSSLERHRAECQSELEREQRRANEWRLKWQSLEAELSGKEEKYEKRVVFWVWKCSIEEKKRRQLEAKLAEKGDCKQPNSSNEIVHSISSPMENDNDRERYYREQEEKWRVELGLRQARIEVLEQEVKDLKMQLQVWKSGANEEKEREKTSTLSDCQRGRCRVCQAAMKTKGNNGGRICVVCTRTRGSSPSPAERLKNALNWLTVNQFDPDSIEKTIEKLEKANRSLQEKNQKIREKVHEHERLEGNQLQANAVAIAEPNNTSNKTK